MSEAAQTTTRSEATASRILDAAEVAFSRAGLRGARVREIAVAAGVSAATLYIYFPSKTELYRAVLDQGMRRVAEILDAFAASRARPDLEALVGRLLRHLAEHPSLSRLVYLEAIADGPFLTHLARTWFRPLLERIEELIRGGEARDLWPDEELPFLTASMVQVMFGPFALAPLFRETSGRDPLAPEALRDQTRFLLDYFARLFPAPAEPLTGDPS